MHYTRKFYIEKPTFVPEDINNLAFIHDGKHLELYYNLIFANEGLFLPDHLRPICWALGDKSIDRLMVIISPGSGKSQLTDIAFPTWELGLDRNSTVIATSAGEGLVRDFLQASMTIVEGKFYKELYPKSIPDKSLGWSKTTGIFLKREVSVASPSYVVAGYGSRTLTGKHASIIIGDDIHDELNTMTGDQLDKVENWYYRTLLGRQNPSGSRIILIGRRWDSADLYGRLKDSGDWLVMTLSNFQEEGETEVGFEVVIPANLGCVFNEFTPSPKEEWVKVIYGTDPNGFFWTKTSDDDVIGSGKYKEAVQIRKNKPDLFQIVYQSRPEETSTAIFRDTDFAYYKPPENVNHGRESRDVCEFLKDFDYVIQTWDTAFTAQSSSDPSVCYTLGLRPCNETHIEIPDLKDTPDDEAQKIPFHFDIYILDEYYAHLDFADLLPESVRLFNLWQPNTVVIEYSALGIPLCRSLEQYNIPVEGIKINNISKRTRAISGAKAGSAQGWFRQHRVLFPGDPNIEWVEPAKKELKDFTGAHNGKDDRVDALVQGINYAIDLGIQYRDLPQGWRSDREIINKVSTWTKQLTPLEAIVFNVTQNINNPFYGLCGTCKHFVSLQPNNPNNKTFCDVNKITVSAIHSCSFYIPTEENQLSIDLTHS